MGKIAVITDSTSYLHQEIIDKYNIKIVSLAVNFGEETYKEYNEISIKDFYTKLQESKNLPTTSQPAIGDFLYLYEELAKDYDEAIAIHISSGISGTMNASLAAAQMVEGIKIEVIDSEISSYGLAYMVIEAAKMAEEGKSLEEIKSRIESIVKIMRGYFVVDDLAHLHRGGRLNAAQFLVGSMLKIKPIIYFNEKKLEPFEKIRTKKKAVERIMQLLNDDYNDGLPIKCSVVHANNLEEAKELYNDIKQKYPDIELNITEFGPVLGTHTGPGTIGLTWYKNNSF